MKFFIFLALSLFLLSCQSTHKTIEITKDTQVRHGWTVFSGPKPTKVDQDSVGGIERGKQLYSQHCAKCHGADGKGKGPWAEMYEIRPANLTALPNNVDHLYFLMQINEGRGTMPSWKDFLTLQQTKDLTSYILTLKKN